MWQVYGQDHILPHLEASLKQGRQAHAYMMVGPPHVGKMTLALNLAQAVNCLAGTGAPCGTCVQCARIAEGHHADIRIVTLNQAGKQSGDSGDSGASSRTVIGIDDIKDVLRQVNLKPFEGTCTVVIIDSAESMSEEAANALLKTLEEPPPQVLILLLTSNEETMLSTIKSRCQSLVLTPLGKDAIAERLVTEHQVGKEEAERLARLSRGCLGWAINASNDDGDTLAQREESLDRWVGVATASLEARFEFANELATLFYQDREAARQLLYLCLQWWRDLLLIKEGAEEYLQNIDRDSDLKLHTGGLTTTQIMGFIRRILETLEALERNASARLAFEVLMLDLPQPNLSSTLDQSRPA